MVDSPTFTQVHNKYFTDTGKTADKALRHEEGKELYTHKKLSSSTVKRAFGMEVSQKRIDSRIQKKEAGAEFIKQSINSDRKYSDGMGERVFQHILQTTGKDLSQGVTARDLGTIKEVADHLQSIDSSNNHINNFKDSPSTYGVQKMRQIYMNEALPTDVRESARDAIGTVIDNFKTDPTPNGLEVMNYLKDYQSMSTEVRLAAAGALGIGAGVVVDALDGLDLGGEDAHAVVGTALKLLADPGVPNEVRTELATKLRAAL